MHMVNRRWFRLFLLYSVLLKCYKPLEYALMQTLSSEFVGTFIE